MSKIFSTKKVRFWRQFTRYSASCPKGSGYCEDQNEYEYHTIEYYIFDLKIWTKVVSITHIPAYAVIEKMIWGRTDWTCPWEENV